MLLRLLESKVWNFGITFVILLNSALLGLNTFADIRQNYENFLNIAITGVNKNYVPYLALKQKRGEKIYDEKNNQWHDRSRLTGS